MEKGWDKDNTRSVFKPFEETCVLGFGHSIGVNLKEKYIWDPNFSQAQELSLENLDKCSGGDYIGVEQVGEIYFKYPK